MPYLVDEKEGETLTLPVRTLEHRDLKALSSPLVARILKILTREPKGLSEIAHLLGRTRQSIYYHLDRLERRGIVKAISDPTGRGRKLYTFEGGGLAWTLRPPEKALRIALPPPEISRYLDPFVVDGSLRATIVVGSPEPHGPFRARSKDASHALELGLFLGTFLTYPPRGCVKLDTEIRPDDLHGNLILVGGPAVNTVTARFHSQFPLRFVHTEEGGIPFGALQSTLSGRTYTEDSTGVIVRVPHPDSPSHEILLFAGRRAAGTRSSVLAFTQHLSEVVRGNSFRPEVDARVVEGVDLDSDGAIDSVEFRE